MALAARRLPGLPADPLSFWRLFHPSARHGFFLGAASGGPGDEIAWFSAGEPTRLLTSLPPVPRSSDGAAPRFVGVVSFDAARQFEPALSRGPRRPDPLSMPPILFGDYRAVVRLDFRRRETTVFAASSRAADRLAQLARAGLARPDGPPDKRALPSRRTPPARQEVRFSCPDARRWPSMVRRAKEAIARGDIYQANLSLRFSAPFSGDPVGFYRTLSSINPSPYACLIKQDDRWIASCSPELLVEVTGDHASTRPIAGTRPRGSDRSEDRRRQGQLLLSPKERAEHIMLVDLERNDLGRVCRPGTVRVRERFAVERYSHVMHIVSDVEGRLARGVTSADALRALFPGGTITGCPKIRSIQIIEALERLARGPFYGSAGYFGWNGDAKFNILIRTALIHRGRATFQAGAGIVADSRAPRERREIHAKARAIVEALQQPSPRQASGRGPGLGLGRTWAPAKKRAGETI